MPEVQIPIFNVPAEQRGLTDREIENRPEITTDRFDLRNDEVVIRPEIWNVPETNHEVVQPPVFEVRTLSHEQELLKIIEVTAEVKLVEYIADLTQHVSTARSYALAA